MNPLPAAFIERYFSEIGVHTPLPAEYHSQHSQAVVEAVAHIAHPPVLPVEEKKPPVKQAPVASPLKELRAQQPLRSIIEATPLAKPPAAQVVDGSSLAALQQQVANCQACMLARHRQQSVFGVGDAQAELVLIGEAPGVEEDRQGEPFVGKSGQLLNNMLAAIGLQRQQVYMMNTVKCRPPLNREPEQEEIDACRIWFDAQLQLLQPRHICLLGQVAAQRVLRCQSTLAELRGQQYHYQGVSVSVTYHPAYLLRTPPRKQQAWEDWQRIKQALACA